MAIRARHQLSKLTQRNANKRLREDCEEIRRRYWAYIEVKGDGGVWHAEGLIPSIVVWIRAFVSGITASWPIMLDLPFTAALQVVLFLWFYHFSVLAAVHFSCACSPGQWPDRFLLREKEGNNLRIVAHVLLLPQWPPQLGACYTISASPPRPL